MTQTAPARGSILEIPYHQMLRYLALGQGDMTRARRFKGYQVIVSCNVANARRNCRLFRYWRRILRAMEAGDIGLASQILARGGPR